ncbi:MAG: glycosyltransferase family 39 protein [Acidobacteriota bacterium]
MRIALFLACAAAASRFVGLAESPPGFYIDEAATAMHLICLGETGADAEGVRFPLFSRVLGGGYSTPIYLYFGTAWISLLGVSVPSFRALAAFFNVLTIAGLYFLALRLFGSRAAAWTGLAAALSPWSFQLSRVAWDPPLAPCLLIWGIYFLIRSSKSLDAAVSGALLVLAAYSYPPLRAQIPLMILPLLYLKKAVSGLERKSLICLTLTGAVLAIPLVIQTLSSEFMARSHALSIFSDLHIRMPGSDSWLAITGAFLVNMLRHLSPGFLFLRGDANLRHSTGFTGQLGWVDSLALVLGAAYALGIRQRPSGPSKDEADRLFRPAMLVWMSGILAGIVPAALTWEGLPHALRSIGAWPFCSLVTGLLLWRVASVWRKIGPAILVVSVLFFSLFLAHYFTDYRDKAARSFEAATVEAAKRARETGDWAGFEKQARGRIQDLALRGYLVLYGGESCRSSEQELQDLRE